MKVLVTGGAGYIGSHIVKKLFKSNVEVTVVDNLSTGYQEAVPEDCLVQIDLCETEKVNNLFAAKNFDTCIHLAASTVVPESLENPIKYYQNNVSNTTNLLKVCLDNNTNNFIFSSTAAIYGDHQTGECSENDPPAPLSPYGHSKLMAETIIDSVSKSSKLKYVNFRYFNVAGASHDLSIGQRTKNASHLFKVITECMLGIRNEITIFGSDYPTKDGTGVRDFIHVEDLAQAHLDAIKYLTNENPSITLNCGYNKGYSVKEVIQVAEKIVGRKLPTITLEKRAGDIPKSIAKAELIRETLEWKPQFDDIESILKSSYDWERKVRNASPRK